VHRQAIVEYKDLIGILELKYLKQDNLLYFQHGYKFVTYDNKPIVVADGFYVPNLKQVNIEFHPLNEQEKSCSHLLIDDSIHLQLKNSIYSLFVKIITTKDGTITTPLRKIVLDKIKPDTLLDPTKNTIYKFNNLFNIATATLFSRNIITFSIDFDSSLQRAKVNFKYPLYDALCTIQNNTIFGIYLEDVEVQLFKQMYEKYIISMIDNLFKKDIEIPNSSNNHPRFYVPMMIKMKIEEAFWKEYDIYYIFGFKKKLPAYYEMLANLNQFTNILPQISKEQQELDIQSYKNELEIRKTSESNWLTLKDSAMQKNSDNLQVELITDDDEKVVNSEYVKALVKHIESTEKKYNRLLSNFYASEQLDNFIQNYNQFKNNQEWSEIFHWQNLVLNILYENGASLWFDTRIDKYCFRSKAGGKIVEENKEGMSELLTRALKEKITKHLNMYNNSFFVNYAIEIVLVSKLNGINKQKLKQSERASNVIKILLFENEIPTIDDDKFDVQSFLEFSKDNTHLFYTRNRFTPTKYLTKRFMNNNSLFSNNAINFNNLFTLNEGSYLFEATEQIPEYKRLSFIGDFIFYLVNEDIHSYCYVMNWLSCFFNSLQKSGTALVLLGDQEATENILLDKIIKEIFGLQYCVTINDKECSSVSAFDIAKDKLFFHIGDITNPATKFDDETLYKLVKDLLVKQSITKLNEEDEPEETVVHGQMIITATNPAPYVKRALSKCTIIKVNDMDTIIEKLGVPDALILEDRIHKDLDNFANILQSFYGNYEFARYALDTKERKEISGNKTSNINKEDVEKEIDAFIQAIKNKDIEYFEKVKELKDGAIYEQLKNAFEKDDGYFIGQDLLHYYNATHEQKFENKKQLMDKLKEKDEMFAQEVKTLKILTADQEEEILFQAPKTSKETGNKELYKISGYTMATDITIPHGAIIISSQDNIKKYNHPDLENAIRIHKEYKEKNKL